MLFKEVRLAPEPMLFKEVRLAPEPKLSCGLIVVLWAGRPPLHLDDGAGHVKASAHLENKAFACE